MGRPRVLRPITATPLPLSTNDNNQEPQAMETAGKKKGSSRETRVVHFQQGHVDLSMRIHGWRCAKGRLCLFLEAIQIKLLVVERRRGD